MALMSLPELQTLVRQSPTLAERYPGQDAVVVEPYEKGRSYGPGEPLHGGVQVMFLPRAVGRPIPVGRDSRALVMLDHPAVSRLHLVLAYTDQGWKVMDRSSNGSWLEGERMPKEQAVPLAYQASVRLGRAVVLRLVPADWLAAALGGGRPAARTPARPAASPWPTPAAPPAPPAAPARPPSGRVVPQFDFEFGADLPAQPAAPTVRISRSEMQEIRASFPPATPVAPAAPAAAPFAPSPPAPPASPPRPPAPPAPPAPPPQKKVAADDIEFEFDFDFGGDGRGGFA